MAAKIISAEDLRDLFGYDPETGVFIRRLRTGPRCNVGDIAGVAMVNGYTAICFNKMRDYAHRLAWLYMTGEPPPGEVDHINGVKTDNRWSNLRIVTSSENKQNRGLQANNKTGYAGIYKNANGPGWSAVVKLHGKKHRLGTFPTMEQAGEAANALRAKLHPCRPENR